MSASCQTETFQELNVATSFPALQTMIKIPVQEVEDLERNVERSLHEHQLDCLEDHYWAYSYFLKELLAKKVRL